MEDSELLDEIRKKNQNAFHTVLSKYSKYVATIIVKVGGDSITSQDTEEICSDVFVKLWEKSNTIELRSSSLKSYIGMMARNHTLNILRTKKHTQQCNFEDIATSLSAEECYIIKNESEILNRTIYELEHLDRELFIRRYFYREKLTDIAKAKNMNIKTVSSKLIKIRKKLKQKLLERRFEYENKY